MNKINTGQSNDGLIEINSNNDESNQESTKTVENKVRKSTNAEIDEIKDTHGLLIEIEFNNKYVPNDIHTIVGITLLHVIELLLNWTKNQVIKGVHTHDHKII